MDMNAAARLAALLVLATSPALADCDEPLAGFGELAEVIGEIEELEDTTVLSAELFESAGRACQEAWIVDVLSEDGVVVSLMFDARTLKVRPGSTEAAIAAFEAGDEEREPDVEPVHIEIVGEEGVDWVEGDWTDDEMTGGPGPDLFVATPGTDVAYDFEPGVDLLDIGDFAREEDGFAPLGDMSAVRAAISEISFDGRPSAELDLDGAEGDWSLTLVGVRPDDLSESDIHFGLEIIEPDIELEFIPTRIVTTEDDQVVHFERHAVEDYPPDGVLIEGDETTVQELERIFLDPIREHFD
ncbi:MAG: hypothetical protein AAF401_11580 [Pseudomonadota bacterium]